MRTSTQLFSLHIEFAKVEEEEKKTHFEILKRVPVENSWHSHFGHHTQRAEKGQTRRERRTGTWLIIKYYICETQITHQLYSFV